MTASTADHSHENNGEQNQDWSHVVETINMLYLAVCQIEATMTDSNSSVDTLTQSFTQLANHTENVSDQIQELKKASELEAFKDDISNTTSKLQQNISASVQAFQFYDRVCQRIDHVARSLEKVTSILSDGQQMLQPSAWKNIQNEIKSSYTMEAERIMFEYIMRGGSVKDALAIYKHHFAKAESSNDDDEIELF